jgi:hypothetical protein
MNLDSTLAISRFVALAKTAECHFERDEIVGTLDLEKPVVIKNVRLFCEEFANWKDTPDQILHYTRKYAPIDVGPRAGSSFRFPIGVWVSCQRIFRTTWRMLAPGGELHSAGMAEREKRFALTKGFSLVMGQGANSIEAERLWLLLNLCFGSLPLERVRVCPAPNCRTPYFVATHLKQTYCGNNDCVEWGKRKLKLEYWNRNKEKLIAKRKCDSKGAENVAKKTR